MPVAPTPPSYDACAVDAWAMGVLLFLLTTGEYKVIWFGCQEVLVATSEDAALNMLHWHKNCLSRDISI